MSPCEPRRSSPPTGTPDFDAFAAMLAARRLYPGAVVAVGALNRNVRDFYRLHAEELDAVVEIVPPRAGRDPPPDRDRGRRTRRASASSSRSRSTQSVEKVLFDHHGEAELPDWVDPEASCCPRTALSRPRSSGSSPSASSCPRRSRRRPSRWESTRTPARSRTRRARSGCRRARVVSAPRRAQDLVSATYTRRSRVERDLLDHLLEELEPLAVGGEEVLLAAVRWPEYVEGVSILAHKIVDLTDTKALVLLVEMDERVFAVVRSRSDGLDASVDRVRARWRRASAGRLGHRAKQSRRRPRSSSVRSNAPAGAATRPGRDVHASALGLAGGKGARRDGALPAARAERGLRRRRSPHRGRSEPRGPRQGRRPRSRRTRRCGAS